STPSSITSATPGTLRRASSSWRKPAAVSPTSTAVVVSTPAAPGSPTATSRARCAPSTRRFARRAAPAEPRGALARRAIIAYAALKRRLTTPRRSALCAGAREAITVAPDRLQIRRAGAELLAQQTDHGVHDVAARVALLPDAV